MRNTYRQMGRVKSGRSTASAAQVAGGASIPAPTGGWDAISPLSKMPPQNAVSLVNFFPQPGYVELRRGFVNQCDTGTGSPVETVMGFQGDDVATETLLAASDGTIFDVTGPSPTTIDTGFGSDRWQFTNFGTSGGSFLWMCNGIDTPQYWDGTTLTAATITGVTPEDMVHCWVYRSRIWTVLKDSTKAAYLPLDSIQGAAVEFDVGNYFTNGGYLQAIGTWSTDTNDGPNEFIAFISSYGDVALFQIEDPDDPTKIFFRGTASIGSPIGRRCVTPLGSDLAVITIDGVLPLSQILTYDRAALLGASITKNIKAAMTNAARLQKDNFGWQMISYPRNTMAILNVPVAESATQDQFVMNTITGAWCRFTGQNGSCWEVFQDRAYFGGNDGIVRLADESGGDEEQTLSAVMEGAFNYYGDRGRLKRWTTIRPAITIDITFPVQPEIGMNVDFETDGLMNPIQFGGGDVLALWNSAIWNQSTWPGETNEANWAGIEGLGYSASIRMTVDIEWSEDVRPARALKINSFDDVLYDSGAFI